jgi:hypothetical protein
MQLEFERAKLISFFDALRGAYSLRYIEICTQINTSALRLLLNQGVIVYGNRRLHIECVEGNYRAIPKLRKATPKELKQRDIAKLRAKAYNHARLHGVPVGKAKLAAWNAIPDVEDYG